MADYTASEETTTRRVYTLPSPTNWIQVSMVLGALRDELERSGRTPYDDTVTVEAWDDEIRFSFEVKR